MPWASWLSWASSAEGQVKSAGVSVVPANVAVFSSVARNHPTFHFYSLVYFYPYLLPVAYICATYKGCISLSPVTWVSMSGAFSSSLFSAVFLPTYFILLFPRFLSYRCTGTSSSCYGASGIKPAHLGFLSASRHPPPNYPRFLSPILSAFWLTHSCPFMYFRLPVLLNHVPLCTFYFPRCISSSTPIYPQFLSPTLSTFHFLLCSIMPPNVRFTFTLRLFIHSNLPSVSVSWSCARGHSDIQSKIDGSGVDITHTDPGDSLRDTR